MSNNVSECESEYRHLVTRMSFLLCMLDLLTTDDVSTFLLTM
jgi:hypothetical protein